MQIDRRFVKGLENNTAAALVDLIHEIRDGRVIGIEPRLRSKEPKDSADYRLSERGIRAIHDLQANVGSRQ